ncbi:HEPN domain-containing protein [Variovorax sp. J31P207]|uniref:HEPN domain-containing protein n=1 Tax=Variovorax sp. J31P207 TaxID=3053510 RepID=UPI002575323F|nr:HEPN domain-containing protein [Variovorax sp. J31P207]MDM0068361.1 HEPN domain-containing protein [Variovorax sp. J31P207]
MPQATARATFDSSIVDAIELLGHFNAINTKPPPPNAEVLKRAGLIMACTAWETYVEDRVQEAVHLRLGIAHDRFESQFLLKQLKLTLKQFNNPNSEKTRKLFLDYLDVDVFVGWKWNNYDSDRVRTDLDALIKKRGDAVHRSKALVIGDPPPHLIKKEELEKAIKFLKCLVDATDIATAMPSKAAQAA